MLRKISFIFLGLLVIASISQARIITAGRSLFDVPVYESTTLENQCFVVIGRISVQASQRDNLLQEMQRAARRYDGDAVLAYRVVENGEVPAAVVGGSQTVTLSELKTGDATISHTRTYPTQNTTVIVGADGVSVPTAEGIIVRFEKDGISSITEATEIPVLN